MTAQKNSSYLELSKHNFLQFFIFFVLIALLLIILFSITLPLIQSFFEKFLLSEVHNTTGTKFTYSIESSRIIMKVNYLTAWAIDVNKGSPEEIRYWFNPLLSLTLPFLIFSIMLSTVITTVLPQTVGYLRQKIDRELSKTISKLAILRYGSESENEVSEITKELTNASIQEIYKLVDELNIQYDDLVIIQRALKWRNYGFLKRLIHINDGLQVYMRFYFTVKYNNTILGMVYMGAAVLIIIIGLRGLKFIPPTQPSLVLFALGLEFTLLITYATTLIYTRNEEVNEIEQKISAGNNAEGMLLSSDFGSSQDIEKLLRVFIKSKKGTKNKWD